jgi:hypothetical protein
MERYGGGSIVISDYNPAWSAIFEQERTSLQTALGPLVLTIEHIGAARSSRSLLLSLRERPVPRGNSHRDSMISQCVNLTQTVGLWASG